MILLIKLRTTCAKVIEKRVHNTTELSALACLILAYYWYYIMNLPTRTNKLKAKTDSESL